MVQTAWHRFLAAFRRATHSFETERTETSSCFEFTIDVRPDELDGGFVAEVISMPGVMSEGETREEAIDNVIEAWAEVVATRLAQQSRERPADATTGTETVRLAVSHI